MIKKGYITFLGTDAHNESSRAPYTQEYIKWIKKKCGDDAEFMLNEAPNLMIQGKYIDNY